MFNVSLPNQYYPETWVIRQSTYHGQKYDGTPVLPHYPMNQFADEQAYVFPACAHRSRVPQYVSPLLCATLMIDEGTKSEAACIQCLAPIGSGWQLPDQIHLIDCVTSQMGHTMAEENTSFAVDAFIEKLAMHVNPGPSSSALANRCGWEEGPPSISNAVLGQHPLAHESLTPSMTRSALLNNKSEERDLSVIEEMHDILRTTGAINLFQFIVNPTSFTQSVENLYYMSFLI
ncbi:uncharacterized protein HD556DRAFT_1438747 [Suillus plorans]|uniref:Non-structural maintenance of chromosome element 4 C-terminal domain-containing protein n=1 Tax=Suillus plorans TaxID=116603 RepID=A0A9P7DQQ8_9AGAM|nr:uncharacterized protein HD556DRAFT_1438747 [Suillus plorans]KAG1800745.1 hypothetical protein HD556DRAFT_1438747 [Suillus plorans]